jgi:hypothetical protein
MALDRLAIAARRYVEERRHRMIVWPWLLGGGRDLGRIISAVAHLTDLLGLDADAARDDDLDMTSVIVCPPATNVLLDRRDAGRAMRVTWHGAEDLFVLSTWRDGVCASTFQLQRTDVPDLITALARGLAETPASWSVVRYQATSKRSALLKHIARTFRPHLRTTRS